MLRLLRRGCIRIICLGIALVPFWGQLVGNSSCNACQWISGNVCCLPTRLVTCSDASSSRCIQSRRCSCDCMGTSPITLCTGTIGCITHNQPVWEANDSASTALSQAQGFAGCNFRATSGGRAGKVAWAKVSCFFVGVARRLEQF